jgi:hypothetical protein
LVAPLGAGHRRVIEQAAEVRAPPGERGAERGALIHFHELAPAELEQQLALARVELQAPRFADPAVAPGAAQKPAAELDQVGRTIGTSFPGLERVQEQLALHRAQSKQLLLVVSAPREAGDAPQVGVGGADLRRISRAFGAAEATHGLSHRTHRVREARAPGHGSRARSLLVLAPGFPSVDFGKRYECRVRRHRTRHGQGQRQERKADRDDSELPAFEMAAVALGFTRLRSR